MLTKWWEECWRVVGCRKDRNKGERRKYKTMKNKIYFIYYLRDKIYIFLKILLVYLKLNIFIPPRYGFLIHR